jgi:hypothetical protein
MKKNISDLVAICGLYCGNCPYYLASRRRDDAQLEKISKESGIPVEKIRCGGCLSSNPSSHCITCKQGFRECAAAHKVTWCFQCNDFLCKRLEDFLNIHIVDGKSHHAKIIENLEFMKTHGIEKWVEMQKRSSTCMDCGAQLYWFESKCSKCKSQVLPVMYPKPDR